MTRPATAHRNILGLVSVTVQTVGTENVEAGVS
jgi:hypothetical protein